MANEALNKLRGFCDGTVQVVSSKEVLQLLEDAIAHEAAQPAHQFAEHQARLVKAKADKAEWDLYMATEGQRVPSFVERDICGNPVQAPKSGGVLRPTSECGIPADGMVNATVSFDVADGGLVGMRIELPTNVARAVREAVATDSAKKLLRAAEARGFQICKQAVYSAILRRWDGVFRDSSPSYDEGMSAALEEISKITFPGGEG